MKAIVCEGGKAELKLRKWKLRIKSLSGGESASCVQGSRLYLSMCFPYGNAE